MEENKFRNTNPLTTNSEFNIDELNIEDFLTSLEDPIEKQDLEKLSIQVKNLIKLINRKVLLNQTYTENVKKLNAEIDKVSKSDIPNYLTKLGIQKLNIDDYDISTKEYHLGSIGELEYPIARRVLEVFGFSDIIKSSINVKLPLKFNKVLAGEISLDTIQPTISGNHYTEAIYNKLEEIFDLFRLMNDEDLEVHSFLMVLKLLIRFYDGNASIDNTIHWSTLRSTLNSIFNIIQSKESAKSYFDSYVQNNPTLVTNLEPQEFFKDLLKNIFNHYTFTQTTVDGFKIPKTLGE